eukprot:1454186-Pleurochrysis_carterae.AAC.2
MTISSSEDYILYQSPKFMGSAWSLPPRPRMSQSCRWHTAWSLGSTGRRAERLEAQAGAALRGARREQGRRHVRPQFALHGPGAALLPRRARQDAR